MGVNGANSLNNVDIVKLALKNKGIKTTSAQIPTWMTPEGSVWNAPKVKGENKTTETASTQIKQDNIAVLNDKQKAESTKSYDDIDKLKTAKSTQSAIDELKSDMEIMNFAEKLIAKNKLNKLEDKHKDQVKEEHEQAMTNLKSIARGDGAIKEDNKTGTAKEDPTKPDVSNMSASEGRAMASSIKEQQQAAKEKVKETEQNTKEVNKFSKDAQKSSKKIAKDQKSLDKQMKTYSNLVSQNQTKIGKLIEGTEETQTEIDSLTAELESLTAGDNTGVGVNSAFSLSLAGQRDEEQQMGLRSADGNNGNQSRINELQSQIQTKTAANTKSGQQIGKLQTSTNKTIATMHKVTTKYNLNIKNSQKELEANEKASDKILKVANSVEEISTIVATGGSAVKYAGIGLVALGSATSWCFGAGAALIAAGNVMQKAGTIAETFGNYGIAAANVTKTACYAAQGNLAGALTSAASAAMAGYSAVDATKGMGEAFKEIDKKATEATQKLAAGVAANESVKGMGKEGINGITKKEAKKLAKDAAMSDLEGMSAKEIRAGFKNGAENALKESVTNTASSSFTELSTEQIKQGLKNGTLKASKSSSDLVKNAAKELAKEEAKDTTKKTLKSTLASVWTKDGISKLSSGLNAAAAALPQNSQPGAATAQNKKRSGYTGHTLTNPSQFNAMFNNNRKVAHMPYGRMSA